MLFVKTTRLLSFLPKNSIWKQSLPTSVNALNGLTFISTAALISIDFFKGCVNALNGLTFISTASQVNSNQQSQNSCQCPQRAYFHFYGRNMALTMTLQSCVNALNGLTFISTQKIAICLCTTSSVSMPSTGLLSFLQLVNFQSYKNEECVNALNGLTFISTVASRNP